jgi:hypothetical protein
MISSDQIVHARLDLTVEMLISDQAGGRISCVHQRITAVSGRAYHYVANNSPCCAELNGTTCDQSMYGLDARNYLTSVKANDGTCGADRNPSLRPVRLCAT